MSPTFSFNGKTIRAAEISVGHVNGSVDGIASAEVLEGIGVLLRRGRQKNQPAEALIVPWAAVRMVRLMDPKPK